MAKPNQPKTIRKGAPIPTDPRFINRTSQVFSRLTVIGYAGNPDGNHTLWHCLCDCGKTKIVAGSHLQSGATRSCGCLSRESARNRATHGACRRGKRSPEYAVYHAALNRCRSPRDRAYKNYGGRGIEFRFKSYAEFINHIGGRPSKKHTLERINNDGHYAIGNVRWVTRKEQAENTRRSRKLLWKGVAYPTIAEACNSLNISYGRTRGRLRYGFCVPCALTLDIGQRCMHKNKLLEMDRKLGG